ncbi:hypothetical protein BVRB_7g167420 [Beta vulgaris subsp. vulgaris]|nr:hypothetical protein BVRB_7g167420 [Beta vulgaris subsp. vulgaris]
MHKNDPFPVLHRSYKTQDEQNKTRGITLPQVRWTNFVRGTNQSHPCKDHFRDIVEHD